MIAFAFPGQGSQVARMGAELFAGHAGFRAELERLDAIAKALRGGRSVVEEMLRARNAGEASDPFDVLVDTHPAIFMIEVALAQVLLDAGIQPDAVIGASLGELAAAAISGALDVESALTLVIRQAEIVTRTCAPGGMVAVVAAASALPDAPARWGMTLAAAGPPALVFAGSASATRAMVSDLDAMKLPHQELPVRFGFHSDAIAPAIPELRASLASVETKAPRLRIASAVTGGFATEVTRDHLLDAITGPMRVAEALNALTLDLLLVDCGPSPTITATARRVLPPERCLPLSIFAPGATPLDALPKIRAAARSSRWR